MNVEQLFLVALVLTISIETAVLAAAWRLRLIRARPKPKMKEILLASALPSALTLPYLWFVIPAFVAPANYVLIGEALVVVAEAPMLAWLLRVKLRDAAVLSLACNAASFFIGGWIFKFA